MSGSASSSDLRSAIFAACSPDPSRQQQANAWLTTFAEKEAAWQGALELLGDSEEQVRFFCANILLSKTRKGWTRLPATAQEQLYNTISQYVDAFVTQPGCYSRLVCGRLCLVLSCMSTLSNDEFVQQLIAKGVNYAAQGEQGMLVCFWLLTAIAEEAESIEILRQRNVASILNARIGDLFNILANVLPVVTQQGGEEYVKLGLGCARAWLKLGHSFGFNGHVHFDVTVGRVAETQLGLLKGMLELLGFPSSSIAEAASEVLTELLTASEASANSSANEGAVTTCIMGLLSHKEKIQSKDGEVCAKCVACVATAIAEEHPDIATRQSNEALRLSELMINCMSRPERIVAENAINYFLALNMVPREERAQPLQVAVYAHLLPSLVMRGCYLNDFTNWDECIEEDEESFHKFRDEILKEALETCYTILHRDSSFAQFFIDTLKQPSSWQIVESTLFCLRAVAGPITDSFAASRNAGPPLSSELIRGLVQSLGSVEGPIAQYINNPWLIRMASKFIGTFAVWFSIQQDNSLEHAVSFLMGKGVRTPEASGCAADAFQNLCSRCSSQLAKPEVICSLAQSVNALPRATGQTNGLSDSERSILYGGLARLTAQLNPEQSGEIGKKLVEPMVSEIRAFVQYDSDPERAKRLSEEIKLIASIVIYLEGKSAPALQVLEIVWPGLMTLLESHGWDKSEEVTSAACEVFKSGAFAGGSHVVGQLPALVSRIMAIFEKYRYGSCLDTLAKILELQGKKDNAELHTMIRQALSAVSGKMATLFQGGELGAHTDLLVSYFTMVDRYLVFAPDILFPSPVLPSLLQWASHTLTLQEREPVQAALAFLTHTLNPGKRQRELPERQQFYKTVEAYISQNGQSVMQRLLWAACDTCPRHLLRSVSAVVYELVSDPNFGGAMMGWVVEAVRDARFLERFGEHVRREDCERLCGLVLKQPRLPRGRFECLLTDFVSVPRGEGTIDALVVYEM